MGDPLHLLAALPPEDPLRRPHASAHASTVHGYWIGVVCFSLFVNVCWWLLMVVDVSWSLILIVNDCDILIHWYIFDTFWYILHVALQRAGEGYWFPFEGYGSCCLSQLGIRSVLPGSIRIGGFPSMWLRLWTEVFVPTYYNGLCCAAICAGCFLLFNVVSVRT